MWPLRANELIPVIAGPTAGGKSDLAVSLAIALRERNGLAAEIITADAFQVYAGLDIGTAKPTVEERRGVPHHLIDVVPLIGEAPASERRDTKAAPFTVNDWLRMAEAKIAELRGRGVLPIVVGGTHLYIKALLDGLFEGPEPDLALREQLTAMDPAARRAELERVDPAAAGRIHPNDVRRTVRALEVFRLTGRPISQQQTQWEGRVEAAGVRDSGSGSGGGEGKYLLVILDWETEALNRRINGRVREMMERGLLAEVHQLHAAGGFTGQSAEALGYKQLLPLCRGGAWPPPVQAVEAAVEQIKIETRRFAKNQRTWLKRLRMTPGCVVVPQPGTDTAAAVEAIQCNLGR